MRERKERRVHHKGTTHQEEKKTMLNVKHARAHTTHLTADYVCNPSILKYNIVQQGVTAIAATYCQNNNVPSSAAPKSSMVAIICTVMPVGTVCWRSSVRRNNGSSTNIPVCSSIHIIKIPVVVVMVAYAYSVQ